MNQKTIETHVDVDAPAQVLWEVLSDYESYERESWNPYIESIEVTTTGRVTATTFGETLGRRQLRAKLLTGEFPELLWEKKLPWVIHARHWFRVVPTSATSTRFVQGEQVSGLLTGLVWHLVERSQPSFSAFNLALKHRAEARWASSPAPTNS